MPVSIKICGLADEQAVEAVIAAGADFAGFVHYKSSPRHIEVGKMSALAAMLPDSIKSAAVLVDPDDGLLSAIAPITNYIQLHGKETSERLRSIRKRFPSIRIIKAISVRSSDDIAQAMNYSDCADMLMFDAKAPELPGILPGGNGLSFDWALLKGRDFPLPWFLSGGLNADNVVAAIRQTGAKMIDVSSGVERAPGVKDAALIKVFVEAARNI